MIHATQQEIQAEKARIMKRNGFCGKHVDLSKKIQPEEKKPSGMVAMLTALLSQFDFTINTEEKHFEEGNVFFDYEEDCFFQNGQFQLACSISYQVNFNGYIEEIAEGDYIRQMEAINLNNLVIDPSSIAFLFDPYDNGEFEEIELNEEDQELLAKPIWDNIVKQNKI